MVKDDADDKDGLFPALWGRLLRDLGQQLIFDTQHQGEAVAPHVAAFCFVRLYRYLGCK